jgi:hypothetical protein
MKFRKEGLVWIIKAIWNLGHKVSVEYFPDTLDEQLISYLFNVIVLIYIILVFHYRYRSKKDKKKYRRISLKNKI